jgi:WD40 repeat protein
VCCAVWAPDGSLLVLGGWYQLAVVDTATWDVVDHVGLDRIPEVMAVDDGGRWLALGSVNSHDVVVLDIRTLEERHRAPLRVDDSVWAMSFSGDGKLLAAGGESGNLHVIDTGTWEAREPVAVRDDATVHLAWLPDDRTVLSAGMDGTVLLFDTKRALVRTPPLPAAVEAANGYAAVVSGHDGDLVLFDDDRVGMRYPMDPSVWLREACAVAGRELTRAEWDRYLPGRDYRATCSDLG